MTDDIVGGGRSRHRYLALYAVGATIGSAVRVTAWIAPQRTVSYLENALLPSEDG